MTFKEIVDRAMIECGYDATLGNSAPRTRLSARVNDWHRRLLSRPSFAKRLRPALSYIFASVASQTSYGLPRTLSRIDNIRDATNQLRLSMQTMDWLRDTDPGLTSAGMPLCYIPRGWFPVQKQPSAACAVLLRGNVSGDSWQTATLGYVNAAGQRVVATSVLPGNGTSTLVTADCVEIFDFYLSGKASGLITIYQDVAATANILCQLSQGILSARFLHVQLWPTPTSAITYTVDASRELVDLSDDKAEPLLPPDFHHVLWRGAVSDEWMLKDDLERADYYRRDLENELRHLNNWLWNDPDYRPGQDETPRRSRLGGGFFPADRAR